HRGLEPGARPIDASPSADHPRTFPYRVGDLRLEQVDLSCARERPEIGLFVFGIAGSVRTHDVAEGVDETVEDGVVHVDALDRRAGLAPVVEGALGNRERGRLDVDVVADV